MRKPQTGGRIFLAKESFAVNWNGADVNVVAGQTRIREGHPLLVGREKLFEPIGAHLEWETATAAPGEERE